MILNPGQQVHLCKFAPDFMLEMNRSVREGEHTRVKICANPDCGWVIYDESRNQTRRWCSAADCGNLIKVRKHRRNKREGKSGSA